MARTTGALTSSGGSDYYRWLSQAEKRSRRGEATIQIAGLNELRKELRRAGGDAPTIIADAIGKVGEQVVKDARPRAAGSPSPATRALAKTGVLDAWSGKRSSRATIVRATGGVKIADQNRRDDLWPFAGEFGVIRNARRKRRGERGAFKGYNQKNLPVWRGNQSVQLKDDAMGPGYAVIPTIRENKDAYERMLLDALHDELEKRAFPD